MRMAITSHLQRGSTLSFGKRSGQGAADASLTVSSLTSRVHCLQLDLDQLRTQTRLDGQHPHHSCTTITSTAAHRGSRWCAWLRCACSTTYSWSGASPSQIHDFIHSPPAHNPSILQHPRTPGTPCGAPPSVSARQHCSSSYSSSTGLTLVTGMCGCTSKSVP